MITPINQTQPQFRAKFYSGDISILANEAKRSAEPEKAMNELHKMLKIIEVLPEKRASLIYRSEKPGSKFNLLLDGKKEGYSAKNFMDALKNLCSKKGDLYNTVQIGALNHTTGKSALDAFAIDA